MVTLILAGTVVKGKWSLSGFLGWPFSHRTYDLASSSLRPVEELMLHEAVKGALRLVGGISQGGRGAPVPLGLSLRGRSDGAFITITGVLPGMALSQGSAVKSGSWQVPATNAALESTWVLPPNNFVGATDLVAELRLADGTIGTRSSIRLEWRPSTCGADAIPAFHAEPLPPLAPLENSSAPDHLESTPWH